jgi:hypothetical protein
MDIIGTVDKVQSGGVCPPFSDARMQLELNDKHQVMVHWQVKDRTSQDDRRWEVKRFVSAKKMPFRNNSRRGRLTTDF